MTEYYGMRFNPFEKSGQAPAEAFRSTDHEEIAQRLAYLLDIGGLGVFTAPPGMGKTFAVRSFLDELNPNLYTTAYVNLTTVSVTEFYTVICRTLGLETTGRRSLLYCRLHMHIERLHDENRQPLILVIDEAQHLHNTVLDEIKILLNYSCDSRSCLTLVLLGEPLLIQKLNRSAFEALAQRITVHYSCRGMDEEETARYVEHKLRSAGAPVSIVNRGLMKTLCALARGNPRQTDRIMSQALTLAAQQKRDVLDQEILRNAAALLTLQ